MGAGGTAGSSLEQACGAQEVTFARDAFLDALDVSAPALEAYGELTVRSRQSLREAQPPPRQQCPPRGATVPALETCGDEAGAHLQEAPPLCQPSTPLSAAVQRASPPPTSERCPGAPVLGPARGAARQPGGADAPEPRQLSGTERPMGRLPDHALLPSAAKPSNTYTRRHKAGESPAMARAALPCAAPHAEAGSGSPKRAVALPSLGAPARGGPSAQSEGSASEASNRSRNAPADPMPGSPTRKGLMTRALWAYTK